jgi:hypothetical protein
MSYTDIYLAEAAKKAATKHAPLPPFIKPITTSTTRDPGVYDQLKKIMSTGKGDVAYTDDGLIQLSYDELPEALEILDSMSVARGMGYSAIIYGEAGLGKSAIIQQLAQKKAAALGREFISASDYIDKYPTAEELKANLSKYYIFIDERVAGWEPTIMSGIPDPSSPEKYGYLKEMKIPWVALMTMSDEAAGMLFLDEVNQASYEQQNALFSLTNFKERTVAGKYKVRGDWRIHAAGNWGEGYSIQPLVPALKERLNPYILKVDAYGWLKWADSSTTVIDGQTVPLIHPLLVDFINNDVNKNFYARPTDPDNPTKKPNPRNLEALSSAIYQIMGPSGSFKGITPNQWKYIKAKAGSFCGKEFGIDFEQFLVTAGEISQEELFQRPELLVKSGGVGEDKVIQYISVLKNNFRNFVNKFETDYTQAKDEGKDDLVNIALNYLYVVNYVFEEEENTAALIFTAVANKAMMAKFKVFRNLITKHLDEAGNEEGAGWVMDVINTIIEEARLNVGAAMGADEAEEEEEGDDIEVDISPEAANNIISAIDKFFKQMKQGTLPQYV